MAVSEQVLGGGQGMVDPSPPARLQSSFTFQTSGAGEGVRALGREGARLRGGADAPFVEAGLGWRGCRVFQALLQKGKKKLSAFCLKALAS